MNIICLKSLYVIANREHVLSSCTTCADINLCYHFLLSPVDSYIACKLSTIACMILKHG